MDVWKQVDMQVQRMDRAFRKLVKGSKANQRRALHRFNRANKRLNNPSWK